MNQERHQNSRPDAAPEQPSRELATAKSVDIWLWLVALAAASLGILVIAASYVTLSPRRDWPDWRDAVTVTQGHDGSFKPKSYLAMVRWLEDDADSNFRDRNYSAAEIKYQRTIQRIDDGLSYMDNLNQVDREFVHYLMKQTAILEAKAEMARFGRLAAEKL